MESIHRRQLESSLIQRGYIYPTVLRLAATVHTETIHSGGELLFEYCCRPRGIESLAIKGETHQIQRSATVSHTCGTCSRRCLYLTVHLISLGVWMKRNDTHKLTHLHNLPKVQMQRKTVYNYLVLASRHGNCFRLLWLAGQMK